MQATILEWPPFRLTWVAPSRGARYGAWQGRCAYHKLNANTDCTKRINLVQGETREEACDIIKLWMLHAALCEWKRDHGALQPRLTAMPTEVLESERALLPPPPDPLLHDGELDDMMMADVASAAAPAIAPAPAAAASPAAPTAPATEAAQAAHRGRGRGRAQAGLIAGQGRGRSRGRGRVAAGAAEAACSTSFSSSSSSAASSSGNGGSGSDPSSSSSDSDSD